MKLLRRFWRWLVGIFSLPKEAAIIPPAPEVEQPKYKPTEPVTEPTVSTGFDPHFLPVKVKLPVLESAAEPLLHYRHFSVAMNTARRMPYYTAVNIDALKYNKLKVNIPSRKEMGEDDWNVEPRLPKTAQLPKSFYADNDFDSRYYRTRPGICV